MIAIREAVPLAPWCTLAVGGAARWFVEARSDTDVLEALAWARDRNAPVLVLGGGSNLVIADSGFPGLVVRVSIPGVDVHDRGDTVHYTVGAGETWDPFVARTVEGQCAGIECLSGIPGLTGGTPIQNVGAYGQEVSSTIRTVGVIDRRGGDTRTLPAAACGFGYRTSRFRHADADRFIVTRVEFALRRHGRPTITYAEVVDHFASHAGEPSLQDVRDAIIEIRSRKGMVIRDGNPANRSCGSFFVNPVISRARFEALPDAPHHPVDDRRVKVPAAWLIERAGFSRGHVDGRVGLSPFQAQGLINLGGASAADVVRLALAIKRAVLAAWGIALVPEPVFAGFGEDPAIAWLLGPAAER